MCLRLALTTDPEVTAPIDLVRRFLSHVVVRLNEFGLQPLQGLCRDSHMYEISDDVLEKRLLN